jgi:hypothetical protein
LLIRRASSRLNNRLGIQGDGGRDVRILRLAFVYGDGDPHLNEPVSSGHADCVRIGRGSAQWYRDLAIDVWVLLKGIPRRGIDMLTYLMQHDADHRGQLCMLARAFGREFSDDTMRLWTRG